MTRNNFLKSIGILAGIAISNPLKLFGKDESKTDYLKSTMVKWGDIKMPDWVKYVSFRTTHRYKEGDRVSFIDNGDGKLIDHIEIRYRDGGKEYEGFERWRFIDEISKYPQN